ncbi:MAG TPA: hypothetical protein VD948_07530, partial [Rhodothermales bacterium]|nr:hypothetical protein [Rhodothermales bacterium]
MHSVTRCVLPALIVLIGIAPARAQEKTSERDTVVVYKLRQATRVMLRTSPRPALRMAPRAALRARAVRT